jgi:hypothetical protein
MPSKRVIEGTKENYCEGEGGGSAYMYGADSHADDHDGGGIP